MSKEYLDVMGDETSKITRIAMDLFGYSNSFHVTGNTQMGEDLFKIAESLQASADEIHRAVGREVSDRLVAVQDSTHNMVHAALAGLQLGREEES